MLDFGGVGWDIDWVGLGSLSVFRGEIVRVPFLMLSATGRKVGQGSRHTRA